MKSQAKIAERDIPSGTIFLVILLTWATLPAMAQDQGPSGATPTNVLEEVIVTATKRAVAAQDLGVSISVLNGQTLSDAGIYSSSGIADIVPNLNISDLGGNNQVELRGISDVSTSIQTAPTVGYYVDEYSVATSGGFVPDLALFDAQRIEVLRGPQGTLFGDGSLSGTIRVISNKPDSQEFSARAVARSAWTKNGDMSWGTNAVVNIPLVEDTLAARVAVSYREEGGWYDNPPGPETVTGLAFICGAFPCEPFDPITDPDVVNRKNTNDEEVLDFKAALRWTPTDRLALDFDYYHTNSDLSDSVFGIDQYTKDTFVSEPREVVDDIFGLTLTYDFGEFELVSATNYYGQDISRIVDATLFAMPLNLLALNRLITSGWADTSVDYGAWSNETRLASTASGPFEWTVGVFYRNENRDWHWMADGNPEADFSVYETSFDIDNESWAIFGEASYDLNEQFEIVGGLRYFDTTRSSTFDIWGVLIGPPTQDDAISASESASEDTVSPRITLNYRPGDGVLLYATAANGFRAGGNNPSAPLIPFFNPGAPGSVAPSFGSEDMWNYELGAKMEMLQQRMQLNVYAFEMDWDDVQVRLIDPSGLLDYFVNGEKARTRGVEVELLAALGDYLTLMGGFAYLDSEYLDPIVDPLTLVEVAPAGNELPRSPETQFNLSGTYRRELDKGWTAMASASYTYRNDTFSDPQNTPAYENDSSSILNARVGLEKGHLGIYVIGDNLTNADQTTNRSVLDTGFLTGVGPIVGNYRRPRTFGLEASYRF